MNLKTTINQNPVATFIIITLALSFAAFFLPLPPESAFAVIALAAVMIPTVVACVLIGLMAGRRGVGAFLRQSFRWRSPLKWYLIAIAIGFVIHLGASVLAVLTGAIPAIEITAPNATLAIIPIAALLEEIGWRGFALRRLLDRFSPFAATLVIGLPWALLHFALFLFFEPRVSPVAEGLAVLVFAFPLTWIFVRSARNVLVATMLHSALNAFAVVSASIPPAMALWYICASGCLVVAGLIAIDRRPWLAQPAESKVDAAVPAAV